MKLVDRIIAELQKTEKEYPGALVEVAKLQAEIQRFTASCNRGSSTARTYVTDMTAAVAEIERLRSLIQKLAWCRTCGKQVEPARYCYANPTCYACLPPPEKIEIATTEDL